MKPIQITATVILLLCMACGTKESKLSAQTPSPITKDQVLSAWQGMRDMVIGSSEKMPAEHFSYSPVEPLATYGGLVSHTAGANYLFAPTVKLESPERKEIDTNNKEQVIGNLKESFAFITKGIEGLTTSDLNEEIEWFGAKMSRLNAILTMTDHLQREYGKNITYLRLKGLQPVRSSGW